jgi:predicted acylesterase/phospholipase RssA/CRP-like cAMP-binding protein
MGAVVASDFQSQVLAVLPRYFGDLPQPQLREIASRLQREEVASGDLLYRRGGIGDCMHFVLTGRLEVRLEDEPGRAYAVAHLSGGDAVGELALLSGHRRAADVLAIRDSALARLSRDDFEAIVRAYPQVGLNLAQYALGRLTSRSGRFVPRVTNIAVVPLHPGPRTADFARRLELALMRYGSTLRLDSATVRRMLGGGGSDFSDVDGFALQSRLDAAESGRRFVLFQADSGDTPWTRKCLSQADRVLLVADTSAPPDLTLIERALFGSGAGTLLAEKELILLRTSREEALSGTGAWLAPRNVERHSNVATGDDRDINRLARLLSGNAVTLVLSGGGARGFAQIGVIRAIREAGVPIDAVGGTSVGAIIGALVALGWDDERILRSCKRAFVDDKPLDDYTVPLFALLRGDKLGRTLRHYMGDPDIVDLWLPYFCISTNISRGKPEAHLSGTLWRAAQASATLPGILPPIIKDGELHVDGGVLDNFPVGTMKRFVGGNTIAVSVSFSRAFTVGVENFPSPLQYLRARLGRSGEHGDLPTLSSLLIQTTTLDSLKGEAELQEGADLYLRPPIQDFDMLDWKSIYKLVDIGYDYARAELPKWIAANPGVRTRERVF